MVMVFLTCSYREWPVSCIAPVRPSVRSCSLNRVVMRTSVGCVPAHTHTHTHTHTITNLQKGGHSTITHGSSRHVVHYDAYRWAITPHSI